MKIRYFTIIAAMMLISCGNIQDDGNETEISKKEDQEEITQTIEVEDSIDDMGQLVFPRNMAAYLYDPLTVEMGYEVKPGDFFDISKVEKDNAFDTELLSYLKFGKYPSDEEQYKPGEYRVTIIAGDNEFSSRINIQDTTPPSITVPDEKIYERGDTILYRAGVEINDNSKSVPQLEIDDSEVETNVAGTYVVRYSATDPSGNTGYAEGKIVITDQHVPDQKEVDDLADEVLRDIITTDMTEIEKARAVFEWCQDNIRVTGYARKDNEVYGAYDGLYYREGDCYTSYATSTWLLGKLGIETIALSRNLDDATHYWCIVNVGDGWYHFDCSHLKGGFQCFMQTDAQVDEYAQKYLKEPEEFHFEQENIPERETRIVYSDPILY